MINELRLVHTFVPSKGSIKSDFSTQTQVGEARTLVCLSVLIGFKTSSTTREFMSKRENVNK
jgi:hypothetical protein